MCTLLLNGLDLGGITAKIARVFVLYIQPRVLVFMVNRLYTWPQCYTPANICTNLLIFYYVKYKPSALSPFSLLIASNIAVFLQRPAKRRE